MAMNLQPESGLGKGTCHNAMAQSMDTTKKHHDSLDGGNTGRIPQTHQGVR